MRRDVRHIPRRLHIRTVHRQRGGLSLLEVLLSLAIFLVAMTGLSQLLANGVRAAVQSRLRTEAIFRCETKMAELVSGAESFQSASGVAFPDDPNWVWSATLLPQANDLLYEIEVVVEHKGAGAGQVEFRLKRLAREPEIFSAETTSSSS